MGLYGTRSIPQGDEPRKAMRRWAWERVWQSLSPHQQRIFRLWRRGCCSLSIARRLQLQHELVKKDVAEIEATVKRVFQHFDGLYREAYGH